MAFWNQYPNRKDWRKESRKCDDRCMPGGECEYCREGRWHKHTKRKLSADEQIKELQQTGG